MTMRVLIALVVICGFLSSCRSNRNYTRTVQDYSNVQTVEEVKPDPIPEVVKETQPEREWVNVTTRREDVELTHGDNLQQYCIILGSFANEQNAINLRRKLMDMRFSGSSIMRNREGMYRVSATCFDDEAQARRELMKIRNNHSEYHDAWLLITK